MKDQNEKSSSGIRNVENEDAIYPTGDNILHKTKEDIRPLSKAARPDQAKKSDTHYVGESSKAVKKTNMSAGGGNPEKENQNPEKDEKDDDLIEKTTWDTPQPEKDKDNPL